MSRPEGRRRPPPELPANPRIGRVVFDLDGTLARGKWPIRRVIGEPISEGVSLLRHYAELGYGIAIYTARPKVDEQAIWTWVVEHDLPVDEVFCEKPLADLYVDDRSWNPWA